MKRREFIRLAAAGMLGLGIAPARAAAQLAKAVPTSHSYVPDDHIKDYLYKMRSFDAYHEGDIILSRQQRRVLRSSVKRLKRLHDTVGYGNFHLISFDTALKTARNYTRIGAFTAAERKFIETIFYKNAHTYGFNGDKPINDINDSINRRNVQKIPRTGHYLYRGIPQETYRKIRKELGKQVILTSGVRGITKQLYLFLNKACKHNGNLSVASRSLAPPGYSFHGVGDFDVGQIGYGAENFTERFVSTEVFRKLNDCGYLKLRYPLNNLLGVRFEPWHIKVGAQA
ncbi:MAG: peptidase M15 [Deltaproteobacteria bacterium]|nr:peptidase M15 [Deltaproteobacteria bacterium]